jgi:NAD(P)-dependent dehydrogenase (short-subunit alcohol dehydrogenase family)
LKLKDEVAIVTGGAQGIGHGISIILAKEGAKVVVADVNQDEAKKTAEEIIKAGGSAIPIKVDVSDSKSVEAMVKKVIEKYGRIDILVNNAGIYPRIRNLQDIPEEEWDKVFAVNLKGVFLCCKAVVSYMIAQKRGKIINISSMSGRHGIRSLKVPHYGASKAGVILFTQAIAVELAEHNINVNAVCPGFVWTPMFSEKVLPELYKLYPELQKFPPEKAFEKFVMERVPLKRPQFPEDIANVVLFLASEDSKNITGQTINVCGGMDMD